MKPIDPGRVAFDIDGVIADTISLFIEIAKEEYHIDTVRYDDIATYAIDSLDGVDSDKVIEIFTRIVAGDFSHPLKPFPGARESLARLHRHTGKLLLVTARPQKEAICDWLEKEIPVPIEAIEVVPTGSFEGKTAVLEAHGITHFVEDRLETGFLLEEAGITPIIFNQPWNRQSHPFFTVNSWKDIDKLIGLP